MHSLSLIMVDASLGMIQCLEEIVSICLAWVWVGHLFYSNSSQCRLHLYFVVHSPLPLSNFLIASLLQISEFVQKDEIKPAVTQLLWERFTEKSPCSSLERRAAVMLLGMMAR